MSKKLKIGIVGAGIQGISNVISSKKGFRLLFLIEIILVVQQLHMEMLDTSLLTHLYR